MTANAEVCPIDDALEDLGSWLRGNGQELRAPLRARLLTGGRSHVTYLITDLDGSSLVLRVPPRRSEGHDLRREHDLLTALAPTEVPTPLPLAHCDDPSVIGMPFCVVEYVEGEVLSTSSDGRRLPVAGRQRASAELVDGLAQIHRQDPARIGLDRRDRGAQYLERQLSRWTRRSEELTGPGAAALQRTGRALAGGAPVQTRTTLVHGDYKFANVMLDSQGGLRAVLDWELATAGDPLCDLGALLAMWPEPDENFPVDSPTRCPGYWTRDQVVERYAALSSVDLTRIAWYHGFGLWRIACLLAGVNDRYRRGVMADDGFDLARHDALVGELAATAQALADDHDAAQVDR